MCGVCMCVVCVRACVAVCACYTVFETMALGFQNLESYHEIGF